MWAVWMLIGSTIGTFVAALLQAAGKECETCWYRLHTTEGNPVPVEDLLMLHGAEGFPPQGSGKS